jgi:hypothetical protein
LTSICLFNVLRNTCLDILEEFNWSKSEADQFNKDRRIYITEELKRIIRSKKDKPKDKDQKLTQYARRWIEKYSKLSGEEEEEEIDSQTIAKVF